MWSKTSFVCPTGFSQCERKNVFMLFILIPENKSSLSFEVCDSGKVNEIIGDDGEDRGNGKCHNLIAID